MMPRSTLLLFILALPLTARAAAVEESTAPARTRTVDDIYQGAKFRDPFRALTGAAAAVISNKAFSLEAFSIHALDLKGIMHDKSGSFALLYDPETRTSFILRNGKLYLKKDQTIPGVKGRILMAQKSVILMTAEKDVQTLRLGESEEDEAGKDDPADGE